MAKRKFKQNDEGICFDYSEATNEYTVFISDRFTEEEISGIRKKCEADHPKATVKVYVLDDAIVEFKRESYNDEVRNDQEQTDIKRKLQRLATAEQAKPTREGVTPGLITDENDPLQQLIAECDMEEVARLIAKLPDAVKSLTPRRQEIVDEIFYQRRLQKDVAADRGVTDAAIRGNLQTIYGQLRRLLDEDKN